ncbi:MAG: methyl-accepting chemotaxis protein [Bacillota bacterium]|nr:methyl-accepting chemotaxis protein [Bacillota bacterium]
MKNYLKKLLKKKLLLLLIMPIIALGITLFGLYYLQKVSTIQSLERDHIELLWKNKYYLTQYIEKGDKDSLEEFLSGRDDMEKLPKEVISIVNWLDKTLLPKEMGQAIDLCNKDIDELESSLKLVNDYKAGTIDNQKFVQSTDENFKKMKEYSDEFHGVFIQVETKVDVIVIVLIVLANLIMLIISYRIVKGMKRDIRSLSKICSQIADGELTTIEEKFDSDEMGSLASEFNIMVNDLKNIISNISGHSLQMTHMAEDLNLGAEQSAKATEDISFALQNISSGAAMQSSKVSDASSLINKTVDAIKEISISNSEVANSSLNASTSVNHGKEKIEESIKQMNKIHDGVIDSVGLVSQLGEKTKEIGGILDIINGISSQTNLLALNAAIEAARAGEVGKGFSVVAEEIRKLAEQSSESTKRINGIISEIKDNTRIVVDSINSSTSSVKEGINIINMAGSSFSDIESAMDKVTREIQAVSNSIKTVTQDSELVKANIDEIFEVAQTTSNSTIAVAATSEEQTASVQEIASLSSNLSKMAEDLKLLISKFKV